MIASLTDQGARAQPLFTPDAAPADIDRLVSLHRRLLAASSPPWSEVAPPLWSGHSVRFLTPDVALIDGVVSQAGSLTLRRIPVLFVMKRQGPEWRIAAFRVLAESTGLAGFP